MQLMLREHLNFEESQTVIAFREWGIGNDERGTGNGERGTANKVFLQIWDAPVDFLQPLHGLLYSNPILVVQKIFVALRKARCNKAHYCRTGILPVTKCVTVTKDVTSFCLSSLLFACNKRRHFFYIAWVLLSRKQLDFDFPSNHV